MTDLDKFKKLMKEFEIEIFEETDEFNCVSIRLKHKHHNAVPLFYFSESGYFVDVETAVANDQCNVCGIGKIFGYKCQ